MEFDLTPIKTKVDSLKSYLEKIHYLNDYLFNLRKKIIETEFSSGSELKRLKNQTDEDYEIYMTEMYEKKNLIYWNNNKYDEVIAKRLGISNVEKLKRRLNIENDIILKSSLFNVVTAYKDSLLNPNEHIKNPIKAKKNLASKRVIEKFSDAFKSISEYNDIMNLLVEKKYIQAGTFIWKDGKKGNKTVLVAILKSLHFKKYYKENLPFTAQEIKNISRNTFGISIGIDWIKRNTADSVNLDFIPLSTSKD